MRSGDRKEMMVNMGNEETMVMRLGDGEGNRDVYGETEDSVFGQFGNTGLCMEEIQNKYGCV